MRDTPGSGRSIRGIAASILVIVVAAVCVRLGFWQLDRLEQRRVRNASLQSAAALPALVLRDSFLAISTDPARFVNRRVTATGSYSASDALVLRGRTDGGNPGVHLVSPLVLGGDTAVMVNRGWVPAPDGASVDPAEFREQGVIRIEGILQAAPATSDAAPLAIDLAGTRVQSFSRLPLDSLRASGRYVLLPLYLQQLAPPPSTGLPRRVPLPHTGEGPHLGYALQWFSFAAIAIVGLIVLLSRSRRTPRDG